jgi:hypothetical protein
LDGSLEKLNGLAGKSLGIMDIQQMPAVQAALLANIPSILLKTITYGSGTPERVKEGLKCSM